MPKIDRRDEAILRAGLGCGKGREWTRAVEDVDRLPIEDLVAGGFRHLASTTVSQVLPLT